MNYEKKAYEVIDASNDLVFEIEAEIKSVGFFKRIVIFFKSLVKVLSLTETLGLKDGLSGEDKKGLAIAILNKIINIPIIRENTEAKIIGFAVDSFVDVLNKIFSKKWGDKTV